jgi:uncharacterized protein
MVPRDAEPSLHRLSQGFPVLCISGPRQSGKTTLARMAYPEKPYLSLEDPDIARLARDDPRGLLDGYQDGLILDEAQYVPEIFAYLKTAVDRNPVPGRFVVTGSQQFNLLSGVTESLAGRAAFTILLPFSISELVAAGTRPREAFDAIVKGFYPPLYDREVSPYDWYTNYIASYVERDVRSIVNVKDLGQFQTFVKMCAARVGQILNLSALAQDCGLSHNTARAWLSVLETSGIVFLLRPYHRNFGKRLVKSPKLYFVDTGLASRLLGIRDSQQLFVHPARGSLFESFIVAELLKTRLNRGLDPDIFFWRDNTGTEIDVVFEDGPLVRAIEIKSGKTHSPDLLTGLESWMRYAKLDSGDCRLVYGGDARLSHKGIDIVPWSLAASTVASS